MNHSFVWFVMFPCIILFGIRIEVFSVCSRSKVQKSRLNNDERKRSVRFCSRFCSKTPMMITRSLVLHKTISIDMMILSFCLSLPSSFPHFLSPVLLHIAIRNSATMPVDSIYKIDLNSNSSNPCELIRRFRDRYVYLFWLRTICLLRLLRQC